MNMLFEQSTYTDPAKRREYHRQRYLANRDKVLAEANARKRALKVLGEPQKTITEVGLEDADRVPDSRPIIDRERRDNLEAIKLRLIWASSGIGYESTVARMAISVLRFVEGDGGKRWTDQSIRFLHRRLCLAEGLTQEQFDHAREAISRELFVPL
jgi:hypothetical protein